MFIYIWKSYIREGGGDIVDKGGFKCVIVLIENIKSLIP